MEDLYKGWRNVGVIPQSLPAYHDAFSGIKLPAYPSCDVVRMAHLETPALQKSYIVNSWTCSFILVGG
jgi:hypothetical protein